MNFQHKQLPREYRFVELPSEEFQKLWNEWGAKIFQAKDISLDIQRILSEEERSQ